MKKLKIALLILVAVVMILPSCKKGANDPFLSLKSRKARITGEWTLKQGTSTSTSSTGTTTETYTATNVSVTDASGTTVYPHTEKITIVKDGTFKIEISTTYTFGTTSTIYTNVSEGNWYFGDKNKDLGIKAKQEVILITTKETTTSGSSTTIDTYSGSDCLVSTMLLDELKNKECVITLDGTTVSGGSSSTTTGTKTYEQK